MITAQQLQDAICRVELHHVQGTGSVVCALVLVNGHVVVGEAHCATGTVFDPHLGARYAREDAEAKVAQLLAYQQRGNIVL